jgi:tetratricopeptide (TPR) repeat protein
MRRKRLVIVGLMVVVSVALVWIILDRTVFPRMAIADATQAFKKGNYDVVEAKTSIALRKLPESSMDRLTPLVFRADARLELGKYDDALQDAEAVLHMVPDHKAGTFYRGVARYKLGQYDAAEADLKAVLAKDDESSNTNYFLGLIAERREDWVTANQYLKAAVQDFYKTDEEPSDEFAKKFAALSRVRTKLGNANEAESFAAIAKRLKPNVSFDIE